MTSRTLLLQIFVAFLIMHLLPNSALASPPGPRKIEDFCKNWRFYLGDSPGAQEIGRDDSLWRILTLPHDWSIEGSFSKGHPATPGGGALPGGVGWYRKHFTIPAADKGRSTFIEFDGVYRNSEVWINGRFLGKRPYGYSSFRYELTPFLKYGTEENILAVKVDNSQQPNSRWYSGSGIYRDVRLVTTGKIYVDLWGTAVTTPEVTAQVALVSVRTSIRNASGQDQRVSLKTELVDETGRMVASTSSSCSLKKDTVEPCTQNLTVPDPERWSLEQPVLYKAVTTVESGGKVVDNYETVFGIRMFRFDGEKGFLLNGNQVKIQGVCNHHDLGCLGAAVNMRALQRQLEIMKAMGVNGIRTSHNPPAPQLLDLCDRMGFLVMDEAFDIWKKKKNEHDYALDWDAWHKRDLEDMVLRDRNHPSVIIWSIGNEVMEQYDKNDTSGMIIARELASLVKSLDPTRPVTAACNEHDPTNPILRSRALDLVGLNYGQHRFPDFNRTYPGALFIGTETTSALATRGKYDMPSDSIRRWPIRWDLPFKEGNPDNTCSSYDNCSAPWGSTHEETWKVIKKHDFLSGMYVWTGFDYLGEPTPYSWPSRSSYFGIVDLAGFPKDAYYMYQSEWTDAPVLHLFPHWNWKTGDTVDVWAYSNRDEVELFLNGRSLGARRKAGDDLHLMWRVPFVPGSIRAVGRSAGKNNLNKEIRTAGAPAKIELSADRDTLTADGKDLSFVTVRVLDEQGTLVPDADNLIQFGISGEGRIAGVDNGLQTSLESFQADHRKAFNGMCLAVVQAGEKAGRIVLRATSGSLQDALITLQTK